MTLPSLETTTYDDTGATPYLELQVYHFSGIQAGLFSGLSLLGIDDAEASSGCFIDTMAGGSLSDSAFYANKRYGYLSLFIALALISIAAFVWRRVRGTFGTA